MNRLSVLFVGVGTFSLGMYTLCILIARLRKTLRDAVELSVPIQENQRIAFPTSGEKCLHVEGPLFTTKFAGLTFELIDERAQRPVQLRPVLFRCSTTTGLSRARLMFKRFFIDHAGIYLFSIHGMPSGFDSSKLAIVFTKPYRTQAVSSIIGLVLSGMLVIASIILTSLILILKP